MILNSTEFISNLVVVIPAYNEEKTIGKLVFEIKKICDVLVVDDCSNDKSREISLLNGAIVHTNIKNKGYSYSINFGIKKAQILKYKYAITLDADGQHDPNYIISFYDKLKFFDIVCGDRSVKQRIGEKIASFITKSMYNINDPLCGLKGYNLESFAFLNNTSFEKHNLIGMELLFIALNNKMVVSQIPIKCNRRVDENRFGDGLRVNFKIIESIFKGLNLKK